MYRSMAFATRGQVEMVLYDLSDVLSFPGPFKWTQAYMVLSSLIPPRLILSMMVLRRKWK